jgi:hypothetical protein
VLQLVEGCQSIETSALIEGGGRPETDEEKDVGMKGTVEAKKLQRSLSSFS